MCVLRILETMINFCHHVLHRERANTSFILRCRGVHVKTKHTIIPLNPLHLHFFPTCQPYLVGLVCFTYLHYSYSLLCQLTFKLTCSSWLRSQYRCVHYTDYDCPFSLSCTDYVECPLLYS